MRRSEPRVTPVAPDEATEEQAAIFAAIGPRSDYNIYRTLARHPAALAKFLPWGFFLLLDGGTLPPRDRELVILRTGFLCRSAYEWEKHRRIAATKGVSAEEIEAVKTGAAHPRWMSRDRALLAACDQLLADHDLDDGAWAALRAHFSEIETIEIIYIVGQYVTVSMMLNSLGVQLEAGLEPDPDLLPSGGPD